MSDYGNSYYRIIGFLVPPWKVRLWQLLDRQKTVYGPKGRRYRRNRMQGYKLGQLLRTETLKKTANP